MTKADQKFERIQEQLGIVHYENLENYTSEPADGPLAPGAPLKFAVGQVLHRLMPFGKGRDAQVVVAFAETPDGNVLLFAREPLSKDQISQFVAARHRWLQASL